METLKVTLIKSHFGRKKGHQATVFALGLKKINSFRVLEDTPAIRGMMNGDDGDKAIRRIEGIINSMTPLERRKPELIKATRKRRIAMGSGVQVQEVNRLLNQFEETQKMMKMLAKGGMAKMMRAMQGKFPGLR